MRKDKQYFDRDLSWLSFNKRVLEEATDISQPLYERIRFLGIYSSNLDEFFRVRVTRLKSIANINKKVNKQFATCRHKVLQQILEEVNGQLSELDRINREELIPELKAHNIVLYQSEPLHKKHKKAIKRYFRNEVLPYLQPVIIHEEIENPPFLENRVLYFVVELIKIGADTKTPAFAILNIPTPSLPRYLSLPKIEQTYYYIHLDDIIYQHLDFLFPGYEVKSGYSIKLNRDAKLNIEEEYSGDLVEKIRKQLRTRSAGMPSRFLYDRAMPDCVLDFLICTYHLRKEDIVSGGKYHNRSDMMSLPNPFSPKLEYKKQVPIDKQSLENVVSIFEAIQKRDYLLHFPYQSYHYVLRFFNEAAIDVNVKEIKATFYRVASDSFILNALISAAKNGKKVTVFLELQARFDEENNLKWTEKLAKEGVVLFYNIPSLKVHAKMALVIKDTDEGEQGFAFLGTGNFNEKTASTYADHGLLTSHAGIVKEVNRVFMHLYKRKPVGKLVHLLVSKFNMIDQFHVLINREISHAQNGKDGRIIIKINNLEDKGMIDKLYQASCAGVKVELIIRGICGAVPGIPKMSENITVRRLVGRYLEHARIFIFHNLGKQEVFMGSADWMERNFYRRIEVVFPIYDPVAKEEILKLLELQLSDNTKARILDQYQNNVPVIFAGKKIKAQRDFYKWLKSREVE